MKKRYKCAARPPERKELSNNPVKMCNEISHLFRAKIRECSEYDEISDHGTRLVLSFLAIGDGVTQLDLVNATHLRPPTISVILKRLEDGGIVERKRDENDLRVLRVYLTQKGIEMDKRNINKIKQVDSIALKGIEQDDYDKLMHLLGLIRDNLLEDKSSENDSEDKKNK